MGMHVILFGDPLVGYEVLGPFKTEEAAYNWAMRHDGFVTDMSGWWVTPLRAQEEFECVSAS